MATVLVIEGDDDFRVALASALQAESYTTLVASNAKSGREMIRRGWIDVIVIETQLPDLDGEELISEIITDPTSQHIPILIVSSRKNQTDRLRGLELGVDDYITKPVSRQEIVLRVKIVLRRVNIQNRGLELIRHEELIIDSVQRQVLLNGVELSLTPIEFRLLIILAARPDQVQSRQSLLAEVWGMQSYLETRTVDAHIKRLREKLGAAATYIHTVRGVGYRFDTQNQEAPCQEMN